MKSVIFLAPPAAGKGTMSEFLVKNYGYNHLSTGDLLRKYAQNNNNLAELLKQGLFVDDEMIMSIIKSELNNLSKGANFILDGMPRTLQQAKKLDIILTGLMRHDVEVIYIDVEKDILRDRVIGRIVCPKCNRTYNKNVTEFKPSVNGICDDCNSALTIREDDNLESFLLRYNTYIERTLPVVAFYKDKGCLTVLHNNEMDQTVTLEKLVEVLNDNKK